ncbi:unnamed protein product [Cuscuta campestris]|uniref:Endoglucanase n=2 Tax=Cuscuta sect. Cleistogrammica TaxID=1824901 RepID=A0A484L5H0_9ASTE|nr:hypothetical protein DM860_009786 [Cuscuta australis]VFQ71520.1 unnamed protein product [Cuscuta campestris]
MGRRRQPFLHHLLLLLLSSSSVLLQLDTAEGRENPDYSDALYKSILFFEGQRSGNLPPNQRMTWRKNSGLSDGDLQHVDLVGGYYDAGDNVKFNFPMAYTTTMLSWGVLEYGRKLQSESQLDGTRAAIRWATDYFLKCAGDLPWRLYVGVGDASVDHRCWERPEDMDTVRTVYSVSPSSPGSDVAGEMAAALAAASLVFRRADPPYSYRLLWNAKRVFRFAVKNKGSYADSLGQAVKPFYNSFSGYKDELLWGAAWLLRASSRNNKDAYKYYKYIQKLGDEDLPNLFSWDNKYSGAYVLLSRWALLGKREEYGEYRERTEKFICNVLPSRLSSMSSTAYTPGGLMYKMDGYNLQYVTSITFLMTTYAKYMASAKRNFQCGPSHFVNPPILRAHAKSQVDYILGDNPLGMSYMVGFGSEYPKMIHHRGSSLPSIASEPGRIPCNQGYEQYYNSKNPNPNILVGAIVGGPDQGDGFRDDRTDYNKLEPTTYTNAAIVGPLAYLARKHRS